MNRPQFAGRLSAIQNGNQRGVYEEQAMRDIPIVDHQRYRLEYVEFAEILDRRLTAYRNCLSVSGESGSGLVTHNIECFSPG